MKKLIFMLLVFSSQSFAQDQYCFIEGSGNNFENQKLVMNEIRRCDKGDALRVELTDKQLKRSGSRSIGNMNTITDIISLHCAFDREIVITEGTNLTLQCIVASKKRREPNIATVE